MAMADGQSVIANKRMKPEVLDEDGNMRTWFPFRTTQTLVVSLLWGLIGSRNSAPDAELGENFQELVVRRGPAG